MGRFGPLAADAVPVLIEMLDGPRSSIPTSAITALGNIGPASKPAVPRLVQLLEPEGCSRNGDLIQALGEIGPDAKEAVPAMLKVAATANPSNAAIVAFGQIGPDAEPAIPFLMERLRKSNLFGPVTAYAVAHSLARIGKASIPALVEALADKEAGFAERA